MRISECHACQIGDHKRHVRDYAPASGGVMGGSVCECEGECIKRVRHDVIGTWLDAPRRRYKPYV